MKKEYIVRLTDAERTTLEQIVRMLKGSSQKVRRPRRKVLDGAQEAKIIARRLGPPPAGFANWSLRLLAEQVVELQIAPAISYETVRRTLKKTA